MNLPSGTAMPTASGVKPIIRVAGSSRPVMAAAMSATEEESARLLRMEADLAFPVYVKPARGGSSIGVSKASDQASFREALDAVTASESYTQALLPVGNGLLVAVKD